jgi:hypothetical protein
MSGSVPTAIFEQRMELDANPPPTLIEVDLNPPPTLNKGLPGHGMVASIAVDQVPRQLDLADYGSLQSSAPRQSPPSTTVRDATSCGSLPGSAS